MDSLGNDTISMKVPTHLNETESLEGSENNVELGVEDTDPSIDISNIQKTSTELAAEQNMKLEGAVCSMKTDEKNSKNFSFDPVRFTGHPICDERMMKNDILKQIAGVLVAATQDNSDNEYPQNRFYFEDTIKSSNFEINVEKVGKLSFPLDKKNIEQLISISSEAKFGLGEKTVHDKSFRNTHMIEPNKLDIQIGQNLFSAITNNIHKALKLPSESTLKIHLHNMLIYGPGQFFQEHRDSEKMKNMIATLVIVLPVPHIGGDLIIKHKNEKHIFSSENIDENDARYICFYSDCLHKVEQVKSGFRVVLTYNVILDLIENIDITSSHINKYLEDAVQKYFGEPKHKNNQLKEKKESKKLIFLLNHSYSEHSLNWNLLKGEDARYALAFRSVTDHLNLCIHLVLIDICQSWSAEEDSEYLSSDEEFVPDSDHFIESIDNLVYWVDENNEEVKYDKYEAKTHEICFTQETNHETFLPLKEEFSGPTGNEGSTVDYWYKRAAVVLWRKADSMKVKFELNYKDALNDLFTLADMPGNESKVKGILEEVGELLHKRNGSEKYKYRDDKFSEVIDSQYFNNFAKVALYVNDEHESYFILSSFNERVLILDNIQVLIRLQEKYGHTWFNKLIRNLMKKKNSLLKDSFKYNITYSFITNYLDNGGELAAMKNFLDIVIDSFISKVKPWKCSFEKGSDMYEGTIELFKACIIMDNATFSEKLSQYLISHPKLFPREQLVKFYFELQQLSLDMPSADFKSFRIHLIEALQEDIAKSRKPNDWSLSDDLWCPEFCDHCFVTTSGFLKSNERIIKIHKNIFNHISTRLQRGKIPVDVSLESTEENAITVLTKRNTIHIEAERECAKLRTLLQSLQ